MPRPEHRLSRASFGRKQQLNKIALQKVPFDEVQRRKEEWADKYTSVDALRETFGSNKNKLWGDLQASTARRLYKTLLPRALLELSKVGGLEPEDLAPLAYQARMAAKMYARERSTVPLRVTATLFDGFRQWLKYGKFQSHGMSYDQLWEKYAERIIEETDKGDVSHQVCQRILERACATNPRVDELCLKEKSGDEFDSQQTDVLEMVHRQLEHDIYQLLLPVTNNDDLDRNEGAIFRDSNHFRTLRLAATARRKFWASSSTRDFRLQRKRKTLDRNPLWVGRRKRP